MAGVYISYPFCDQKCTYCNFASGVMSRELEARYLRALEAEILHHTWEWTPETLYIGGGTPSRLEAPALDRLLAAVSAAPWSEATLEAAPGSITPARAAAWRNAGINRVSLGVQSFVPREIARTGRKHTPDTVAADIRTLRDAGIENHNIDLIAGLPFQTVASWAESLDWIERLQPAHVSVYMLEVDEDSRLGLEILGGGARYGARDVPGEEQIAELYEMAVDRLATLGISRYEISNFARPGRESLHNLKYWRLAPYAGFGSDAHSFDGRARWGNVEGAADYTDLVLSGQSPRQAASPAKLDEERFFVGLRLSEGIRPSPEEWRRHADPIGRFLNEGLLESDGRTLRLTRAGILLSNEVFSEFIL